MLRSGMMAVCWLDARNESRIGWSIKKPPDGLGAVTECEGEKMGCGMVGANACNINPTFNHIPYPLIEGTSLILV